ncbi:MAG: response regulator [Bacteroidetes bacterium]|jgi:two-component system LytT family response regulator|nr:response regulator [Bacteroidota bacterium]
MKIIIVDDELSPREHAKRLLAEFFPEIIVCAEAENIVSAYEAILLHQPDVVLLDVDLTDGTAFELLNRFQQIHFSVIFITAFEQYAIKAIKFSALDYLLKPYTTAEFVEAIRKAQRKETEQETNLKFNVLLQNFQYQQQLSKIVLRTSDSIHVVQLDDIIRLQADGAYTAFYLVSRKPIVISKNLKEYDNLLENNGFIRTHQSHLVNSKHIVCFHKSDGGSLGLSDKTLVPVATRFREKVIQQLEKI